MRFGEEELLLLADFFESVCPSVVLLLVWHCHLDDNSVFFPDFHDLPIGESFVADFGEFFSVFLEGAFLLGVTHYDINQIYSPIPPISTIAFYKFCPPFSFPFSHCLHRTVTAIIFVDCQ